MMRSMRFVPALFLGAAACALPARSAEFRPPGPSGLQTEAKAPAVTTEPEAADAVIPSAHFDALASSALDAMQSRAEAMKVSGVAVVAYFEGEKITSWSSKMRVVGRVKDEPNGSQKGNNLLAIAYAKAAEMADTLKNSGSQARPPMTGEFGWEGGVIVKVKAGYLIVAFSGGQSADDVAISRTGEARVLDQVKADSAAHAAR